MTTSHTAIINPKLLIWARSSAGMETDYASKKLGVSEERLIAWENGSIQPTIKQLRKAANVYKQNFAAFFLPSPPEVFKPPLKDYRRHHGANEQEIAPEIILDVRDSLNKREIALELLDGLGEIVPNFDLTCNINEKPEEIGLRVRDVLGMSFSEQKTLKDPRIAFNYWKERLEKIGVLVFQSTKIEINEMRGFSIYSEKLPLVVINRKDAYSARTFTLFHELTHLMLRKSGLCDLEPRLDISPQEQKLEVFCNAVAAQTLVPDKFLLSYPEVSATKHEEWTNHVLSNLSRDFGVSREVVLRRLLDLGLTSQKFYEELRRRYTEEAKKSKAKKGFVTPSIDAISSKGKRFAGLVLESLNSAAITQADASDYLGVKAKHFGKIADALGMK
jgi:Zn-dependent peptidase ImmA (M78 family)/DNA-binding XRE family transcriptional regulator